MSVLDTQPSDPKPLENDFVEQQALGEPAFAEPGAPLKNQTLEDQNAALRDQSLGPGEPASAHG